MKLKYFLFLIYFLGLIPIFLFSQNFATIGAKWTYQVGSGCCNNGNELDFIQWTVWKDTIIHQKNCRMIIKNGVSIEGFSDTMFVYQQGQQVFYYDFYSDNFTLLYDFSKQKNESWVVNSGNCGLNIIVEEVSLITINQHTLKQLKVTSDNSDYEGYIIEKIGYLKKPQPDFSQYCYGLISYLNYYDGLRCYEDPEIGFYDFQISPSCDFVKVSNSKSLINDLKILPNPNDGHFLIHWNSPQKGKIVIYNSLGHMIQEITLDNENQKYLDLTTEVDGIYFLQFSSDTFQYYFKFQVSKN